MKFRVDPRFALVTAAALAVLYGLSSVPGQTAKPHDPALLFLENLLHAPLFAALAFAWHKMLTKGQSPSIGSMVLTVIAAGACAVLDEWHQSFVPGRDASTGDLLVDFAGIGTTLIFLQTQKRSADL